MKHAWMIFLAAVLGIIVSTVNAGPETSLTNNPQVTTSNTTALDKITPDKIITIRADEWFPFNGKPGSEHQGYMIDIARYAFEKEGYQLDYQILPWERSLEETARGNIDCVVGAHKSEAPEFIYHELSLGEDTNGFYSLIDYPDFNYVDRNSLEGRSIAVIGGYGYGAEVDAYIKKYRNTPFIHIAKGDDALDRNIKMLLSGRVELLVESRPVFENKLTKIEGSEFIKAAAYGDKHTSLYIACGPKNPEAQNYANYIDNALHELRASGKLKELLEPYGVIDWETLPAKH